MRYQIDSHFQESQIEIDTQWKPYTTAWIESLPKDCLIAFRPLSTRTHLGCIRVYQGDNKLWDNYNESGTFVGKIPRDCAFEAMLVEIKFIRLKEVQN